jgi:hypothetical protein
MRKDLSLKRIILSVPVRLQPAKDDVRLCGVVLDLDMETGKALAIQRIQQPIADEEKPEGKTGECS